MELVEALNGTCSFVMGKLTWVNSIMRQGDKDDQHHKEYQVEEEVDTDTQPFNRCCIMEGDAGVVIY